MKALFNKIGSRTLAAVLLSASLQGCADADPEFVHNTNTISQMVCQASHSGSEFLGAIYEYDKNGDLVPSPFTQDDVEGGYGLILFAVSKSLADDVDLTDIFLKATVSYDEFISVPGKEEGLKGRHDITGDGIIITVTSGVGTTRQYRVRGYYE